MALMRTSVYDTDVNLAVDVAVGGSNATTAAGARTNLGIQQQDGDLDGIVTASSGTGVLNRTGSNAYSLLTFAGTSNKVTVTNPAGVAGNITLDVGSDVYTLTGNQTISAVPTYSGGIKVDTISESTAAAGVTVDSGALYKDSTITLSLSSDPSAPSANNLTLYAKTLPIARKTLVTMNEFSDVELVGLNAKDVFFGALSRQAGISGWDGASSTIRDSNGLSSSGMGFTVSGATGDSVLDTTYGTYGRGTFSLLGTTAYAVVHASNAAGHRWGDLNAKIVYVCVFRLSAVGGTYKFLAGLINTFGSANVSSTLSGTSPDTTYNHVAIKYYPGQSDTSFLFYYNNGATTTSTTMSVTPTANKVYIGVIVARKTPSNRLEAYIYDDTQTLLGSASGTSNLPSFTADMYGMAGLRPSAANTTVDVHFFNVGFINQGFGTYNSPV